MPTVQRFACAALCYNQQNIIGVTAMIGYVTEQELTDYAAARGITIAPVGGESVLLTKALDWLELQPFAGEKTDPEQELSFPRNGDAVVPMRIKKAQMVCALLYNEGSDPLEAVGPQVTQETVVGAVSVSYSDLKGNSKVLYPQLDGLLDGFLDKGNGNTFSLSAWL